MKLFLSKTIIVNSPISIMLEFPSSGGVAKILKEFLTGWFQNAPIKMNSQSLETSSLAPIAAASFFCD